MKHLFIDANIWLSLYLYDKKILDDFDSLREKLNGNINLIISQQVYDEVLRNRDGKIYEAWNKFSHLKFNNNAPFFCQQYPECKEYQKQNQELERKYKVLINVINSHIHNHTLKADQILAELFDGIKILNSTSEIIEQAEFRYKSGNPPGKNNSFGDAINWELLLQSVPDREDLYLISGDGDFCSKLDNSVFNAFLEKEWKDRKMSNIFYYNTIHDFLENYAEEPDNNVDVELRKRMLRISKAMKQSMERIKKEHQYNIKKSFEYDFGNFDRKLFETILNYWALKKEDRLQTEDQGEDDDSHNSTDEQDEQSLDQFEEDNDCVKSSIEGHVSNQQEEENALAPADNQDLHQQENKDESSLSPKENQVIEQQGKEGDEDVVP